MFTSVIGRLCCGVFVLISLAGCAGYQLGNIKPLEFSNIESIAIPTFKNETLEPRLATLITSNTVDAFLNDGTFAIETAETADAILYATIERIERIQLRSARFNQLRSRELLVRMEVEYRFVEAGTGIALSRGKVRGDSKIFLDPNFQLTERQAMYQIGEEVAAELVLRLVEGWPDKAGSAGTFSTTESENRIRRLQQERRAEALGLEPTRPVTP